MLKNYLKIPSWNQNQRHKFVVIWLSLILVIIYILAVSQPILAISTQSIAQLTNSQRAGSELPALNWNGALANSAWQKAEDMCADSYWAHTAPDGATGWTFMRQSGYAYTAAGENLARGFDSDTGIVAGWMASPGHRANILHTTFTDIGVGSATCIYQGVQTTFVVAHYGATAASTSARNQAVLAAAESDIPQSAPATTTTASPPAEVKPAKTEPSFGAILWKLTWGHNWSNELLF